MHKLNRSDTAILMRISTTDRFLLVTRVYIILLKFLHAELGTFGQVHLYNLETRLKIFSKSSFGCLRYRELGGSSPYMFALHTVKLEQRTVSFARFETVVKLFIS